MLRCPDFSRISATIAHPLEEMVLRGVEHCREYNPDLIVAVGGGSSIDTAKAIWILYERPDLKIGDINPFEELNLGRKAKLVAVPTTSGTGSEVTWAVVITRHREDGSEIKLELANREVVPNYAILDPVFTMKMPPNLTAATAFDALSHAYEGLIAVFRNDISEGVGIKSIELVREFLPIAYNNPDDIRAREALHNAATLAGLCFGNSQAIMGHSLGHALGAVFHKPHGFCVGLFLPYILQFQLNAENKKEIREIIAKVSKMLSLAKWSDDEETAIKKVFEDIRDLQEKVNFPRTIKDLGIAKADFEAKLEDIVNLTLESPSSELSDRPGNAEDYKKILEYAFEGKEIDW